VIGALITALLSWPRLALWRDKQLPTWYLEAFLFLGSIVLWGFVFAWHTEYTQRPVINFNLSLPLFAATTFIGVLAAIGLHLFIDPILRAKAPDEFPDNFEQWIAMTLFTLSFGQLYLIFAPFAWLMRLLRNRWVALVLTVLFIVLVLVLGLKRRSATATFPPELFATLVAIRTVAGAWLVWLYLRGGLILVWWVGLLVEARHLLTLQGHS
jgi:multisubunit Na+/H+ antiporter MnhG subunit